VSFPYKFELVFCKVEIGYMFTDLELMNIHARTLFTHDSESRLLFVNEPDSAVIPAPRLFLGRTRAGSVWRFRADLPENLCDELSALCADEPLVNIEYNEPPRHLETFVRLLERHAPVREVSNGLAYQFTEYETPSKRLTAVTENNAETLHGGFEKLIQELPAWQPFVALVEENQAVSVCRSVRITAEAHEAGVETLPDFRGKGYAGDVTTEWARLVRATGAIPLYSTSWENNASQAVARKLELKCYGVTFDIA
jgi:RimJ/RimL family protein N-acetyltransferase